MAGSPEVGSNTLARVLRTSPSGEGEHRFGDRDYSDGHARSVRALPGEPKPVTAFVLSMVGGVFILLGGAFEFYFSFFYSQVAFPPRFGDELAVLGAIGIGVGVLAIVFAVLLYLYPQHHALFGGLILVARRS